MSSLKQVAIKAEVSTATVSRFLNNPDSVKIETRLRIEKIIKQLNYRPSRVARRLRVKDGDKKMFGLIVPDIQNPFYVDVVKGVEDGAYSKDYAVLMCNFGQEEKRERMYLDIMQSESVDGLIVAPIHEKDPEVIKIVKAGLPVVCVDRGLSGIDVDVILVDNKEGAYKAVDYLAKLGHKGIAYIGGLFQIPTSRHRRDGYIQALEDNGLKADESYIKFGDSKFESGKSFAKELLNLKNPPTALFTGNNLITLGALDAIHSMGLNIPKDVAIIGFDDMPWSSSLNPALTAVSQPGYEIGKRAVELLIQRLEDPERPKVEITLKTKFIVRESC
jgi:LacI family transcriptional regulator/LacI family repressor for deo operon, udp, cdd, tsx, nupC, and nupG